MTKKKKAEAKDEGKAAAGQPPPQKARRPNMTATPTGFPAEPAGGPDKPPEEGQTARRADAPKEQAAQLEGAKHQGRLFSIGHGQLIMQPDGSPSQITLEYADGLKARVNGRDIHYEDLRRDDRITTEGEPVVMIDAIR